MFRVWNLNEVKFKENEIIWYRKLSVNKFKIWDEKGLDNKAVMVSIELIVRYVYIGIVLVKWDFIDLGYVISFLWIIYLLILIFIRKYIFLFYEVIIFFYYYIFI